MGHPWRTLALHSHPGSVCSAWVSGTHFARVRRRAVNKLQSIEGESILVYSCGTHRNWSTDRTLFRVDGYGRCYATASFRCRCSAVLDESRNHVHRAEDQRTHTEPPRGGPDQRSDARRCGRSCDGTDHFKPWCCWFLRRHHRGEANRRLSCLCFAGAACLLVVCTAFEVRDWVFSWKMDSKCDWDVTTYLFGAYGDSCWFCSSIQLRWYFESIRRVSRRSLYQLVRWQDGR